MALHTNLIDLINKNFNLESSRMHCYSDFENTDMTTGYDVFGYLTDETRHRSHNYEELVFEPEYCSLGSCSDSNIIDLTNDSTVTFHFKGRQSSSTCCNSNQMFYDNLHSDRPEFIDVNKLAETEFGENNNDENNQRADITDSDEDDDVIFVREYKKENADRSRQISLNKNLSAKSDGLRRNPIRQVRNSSQKFGREHFLEDDFAFLDHTDDEDLVFLKKRAGSSNSSQPAKEWPTNVYDRPEYNYRTNKTEAVDYTIREIQNNFVKKRSKFESVVKVHKKGIKRKYFARGRRAKQRKVEQKVPIAELRETVKETYSLVENFYKEHGANNNYASLIFKNQKTLLAIVNNLDYTHPNFLKDDMGLKL